MPRFQFIVGSAALLVAGCIAVFAALSYVNSRSHQKRCEAERPASVQEPQESGGVWSRSEHRRRRSAPVRETKVRFFLYEPSEYEPRLKSAAILRCPRKGADYMFMLRLRSHPWRTWDHEAADVIVVPCLEETQARCTESLDTERPPSHERRLSPPPRRLDQDQGSECWRRIVKTDIFNSRDGKDHLFIAAHWQWQFGMPFRYQQIGGVTLGQIEIVDRHEAYISRRWRNLRAVRCSVVVPFASDVGYHTDYKKITTFEEWTSRKTLVSYMFSPRRFMLPRCPKCYNATPVRRQSLHLARYLRPHISHIHMHRLPIYSYIESLQSTRFCLVIRGDTPSTHGFYDSVAANCIPILVSDRFDDVARPLAHGSNGTLRGGIDVSKFSIIVKEEDWLNDLPSVAARIKKISSDPRRTRFLFEHMQMYRPQLLWSMPGTLLHEAVLTSAWNCL